MRGRECAPSSANVSCAPSAPSSKREGQCGNRLPRLGAGFLALGLGRRTMRRPPKRTSRLPPSTPWRGDYRRSTSPDLRTVRIQWRDRAGLSPASLLNARHGHPKASRLVAVQVLPVKLEREAIRIQSTTHLPRSSFDSSCEFHRFVPKLARARYIQPARRGSRSIVVAMPL